MGYNEVYDTAWSSFLVINNSAGPVTCSLLMSVSASQSGRPNLYSVEIRRIGVDGIPVFHLRVLSGSYELKLAYTTEGNGRFKLFIKKGTYTPVVWVKLLTRYGVKGLAMEKVAETEIVDAIEIDAV